MGSDLTWQRKRLRILKLAHNQACTMHRHTLHKNTRGQGSLQTRAGQPCSSSQSSLCSQGLRILPLNLCWTTLKAVLWQSHGEFQGHACPVRHHRLNENSNKLCHRSDAAGSQPRQPFGPARVYAASLRKYGQVDVIENSLLPLQDWGQVQSSWRPT